jgi:quercetin dioxygenase-like cupin family protein
MAKELSGMIDLEGKKPDLRGKILVAKDLLNYQEGAVVSRTLVDKKVGTLTIFSFDVDQGLSEHTAPYDATVLVLEGEVDITVSGRTSRLAEGDMMIMPANEPHALKAIKPFKMMLIMIRA